ncbi:MAG: hypothetical protein ACETWE_11815 [Candidatus Bathyarchaeia archaeon]
MMGRRTLVHVTEGGVTEEYAPEIADVSKNKHSSESMSSTLKSRSPDLTQSADTIIGSDVRV